VCGTDYHAYAGRQPFFSYPRVLGHELAVEVVETNPGGGGLVPGTLCAVRPYLGCGSCAPCRRGRPNCCTSISVLGVHEDGGIQSQFLVPLEHLHPSNSVPPEQLALVETLCIGAHAVRRAQCVADDVVVVVGAGPVGLAAMQMARVTGATVIAVDVAQPRLEFAKKNAVADHVIDASTTDVALKVRQLTECEMATVVLDATGNLASMTKSLDLGGHGARICFIGFRAGDVTFEDVAFHKRELTILASRNATAEDFQHVISLLESKKINTSFWITHTCSMTELPTRFPEWCSPEAGVIKAIVNLD